MAAEGAARDVPASAARNSLMTAGLVVDAALARAYRASSGCQHLDVCVEASKVLLGIIRGVQWMCEMLALASELAHASCDQLIL